MSPSLCLAGVAMISSSSKATTYMTRRSSRPLVSHISAVRVVRDGRRGMAARPPSEEALETHHSGNTTSTHFLDTTWIGCWQVSPRVCMLVPAYFQRRTVWSLLMSQPATTTSVCRHDRCVPGRTLLSHKNSSR